MLNKGCPICGGDVYAEIVDYGVVEHRCFQAGHLVSDEHINKVQAERGAIRQKLTKEKKEATVVDYKEMNMQRRGRYIKEHLVEIVEDIKVMSDADVMAKWGFKDSTCYELRKKHAPGTLGGKKNKKPRKTPVAKTGAKEKTAPGSTSATEDTAPLTEHERYLILLGYQQATREFLQSLKNTFKKEVHQNDNGNL